MKPAANDRDPAFPAMAMDILSNVLSRTDNPGNLGTYLTEEVRDLTGARCVLLFQCQSTPTVTAHQLVSVNPLRMRQWAESPAGNRLVEAVLCVPEAQHWRGDEPSEIAGLLRQEGFELSMGFPLHAGGSRVGAMLVLGLPDEEHVTSVLGLLNNLSAIVALVLRNAILFDKQEQIIQERTAQLRDRNEKLAIELAERKRAEERQREQYSTLRGIIDGLPAPIFSVDRQYRYTSFNAGHAAMMKALYGVEIEQGHSMLDYMTVPEDQEAARHNLDRAAAGEQLAEEAYSGEELRSRRYFHVSHSPIKTDEGEIIGVAVLAQDMTERKSAEEGLDRLNRELRAISSCNQVLMRAEDEQTLLNDICRIICDEAGYRMAWVGYAENDDAKTVRPVAWAGVEDGYLAVARVTWADTERGRGATGTAIRSGQTNCVQDFTDPQAGPWRENALQRGYRSSIAVPLKDESANTFGALTIYSTEPKAFFTPDEIRLLEELSGDLAFGITVLRTRDERKEAEQERERLFSEAEQERERAEARAAELDAILSAMTDGVVMYAPDGKVVRTNKAAERIFSLTRVPPELPLAPRAEQFKPIGEDGQPLTNLDDMPTQRALRGETVDNVVLGIYSPQTGQYVWLADSAAPVRDAGGRLIGAVLTFRDITERKRLEEQLQQSQKMEAIGRLAGGIAHDFNNLLTAINGYADILVAGMAPDEPRRSDVEEIRKAGDRAAALTRQLLAFSRRQVLQPVVIDPSDVVAGIAPMLRRLVGEQIELRTPAAPDLGRVRADPSQIEQVLLNLVVNARDAMPAGGTLTIETANTELDDEYARNHPPVAPGPYVLLAVSDTGTGMDAVTMAHLFEPFFTTKPAGEGTGLGLATVYGIVAQSGGHVTAYSEPGHGSTFKVFLPRVAETVEPRSEAVAEPAASGAETVLVVEDEDAVRSFVERVLGGLGYTVTTARSGAEALALAAHHRGPIDLLVTDVMLPGMNGRELSERLTALRPSLRTLFISGYTEDSIVHRGELGPDVAFLSKPFTPDALGRAVREVFRAQKVVSGGPDR
jgi:PAS domain S-box-containing protein